MKGPLTTLLLYLATLTACGSPPPDPTTPNCAAGLTYVSGMGCVANVWDFGVSRVSSMAIETDDVGNAYAPDPNYVWLNVSGAVTNKGTTGRCLDWMAGDGFTMTLDATGDTYGQRLQTAGIIGYLPDCYEPQETLAGFWTFQVPVGSAINNAMMTLQAEGCVPVHYSIQTSFIAR